MSHNLPQVPDARGPVDLWSRFSADPRVSTTLRSSDADRDIALEVVNRAFTDGRLDAAEHDDRLQRVLESRRLGDLVALLSDIAPKASGAGAVGIARLGASGVRESKVVRVWAAMSITLSLIWVASWLLSGDLPYYFWPAWPMLVGAIPLIVGWLVPPDPERQARRQALRDARRARRDARYSRRDARLARRDARRGLIVQALHPEVTGGPAAWPQDPRADRELR